MKSNFSFIIQALMAAMFFGASAPISKLLLGDVPPVLMAAFLYLGSGTGISLIKLYQRFTSNQKEAGIKRPDVLWLAGAIISGGILAPILLMISLKNTPASTASLLLNFEGVGTTLIALFFFRKSISRRAYRFPRAARPRSTSRSRARVVTISRWCSTFFFDISAASTATLCHRA